VTSTQPPNLPGRRRDSDWLNPPLPLSLFVAVSFSQSGPHHGSRFREAVEQYSRIWNSLDVRYSAYRARDTWWNFVTEIRLHPDLPGATIDESLVELDDFVAGKLTLPMTDLAPILDGVDRGQVRFGDHQFKLAWPSRTGDGRHDEQQLHPVFSITHPEDGWRPFWQPEVDSVAFELGTSGGSLTETFTQEKWTNLERRLLTHTPPYFGMEDLMLYFLRANPPHNPGGSSRFFVAAPLYTRIESSDLSEGGTLGIRVRSPPQARPCDMRVVARRITGSKIERVVLRATENEALIAGVEPIVLNVPLEGCDWIDGAIIFVDERVDRFQFALPTPGSPNPRLAAVAITDLGARRFAQFVEGDESVLKIENGQEVGFSWLLALCGFQVLSTGLRGFNMGAAPDLVAFVPFSNLAIVVEATTRDLMGEGKLVRLADRAESLRRELSQFEVIAVALTGKRALSQPEVDQATHLGIKILVPDDCSRLRDLADQNEGPRRAFEYIKAKRNQATAGQLRGAIS
jgi:hypothetical protein